MKEQISVADFVRKQLAAGDDLDTVAKKMLVEFPKNATCRTRNTARTYAYALSKRDRGNQQTQKPMAVATVPAPDLAGINHMSMPAFMRQQFNAGVEQDQIVDQCIERYGVNRKGALGSYYAATKKLRLGTETKAEAPPSDSPPETKEFWFCKKCPECGVDLRAIHVAMNREHFE